MRPDPIVAEIREVRHQISAKFGHNTERLGGHYKQLDKELRESGDFRFVTGFFSTDLEKPLPEKAQEEIALAPANLRVRQKITAKAFKQMDRHKQ